MKDTTKIKIKTSLLSVIMTFLLTLGGVQLVDEYVKEEPLEMPVVIEYNDEVYTCHPPPKYDCEPKNTTQTAIEGG